ncbi:MAG: hypothetical protein H6737_19510 [Alphaproteobacteria bacterium]|nr:hypothetical protein [Alphaproteobacteria bacterium]
MVVALLLALAACRSDPRCPETGPAITCDGGAALVCEDGRRLDETTCGESAFCAEGAGCVECRIDLPEALSVPIDTATVAEGEAWRTLGWRAVLLPGGGDIRLDVDGPFELYDGDGHAATDLSRPAVAYVRAVAGGTGTLTARFPGCDDATVVALAAHPDPGLSATPRAAGVAASFVDAFPAGSTVRVALDPLRDGDRIGQTGSLYVVADRDREAWLADPGLVDVLGAPRPVSVLDGGLAVNLYEVWADVEAEPGVPGRYDLVIDWDGDGLLSPGDRIDGLDGAGFTVFPPLDEPGPFIPRIDDISSSFWLTERVYWPIEIDSFDEPAPLVVISHGNGHEHTWYDYLGQHLASWGYVVMAHRNDTQPGIQSAATTTLSNTEAFVANHPLLDSSLEGHVDTHRITWIGHSRGAEGILVAYDRLLNGGASVSSFTADDIVLLSSIAPTVFEDPRSANPHDVPFHILSGGADGDVTGGVATAIPFPTACSLCQWWRLAQGATGPTYVTYLHGAIHNDFNCCGVNDGFNVSAPKIGRDPAQRYTKALYTALLEHVVRGDPTYGEFLTRMPEDLTLPLPPDFAVATQAKVPATRGALVVEDFQVNTADPALSSSGTPVRHTVATYLEGRLDDANNAFAANPNDPMNGMTQSHNDHTSIAARGAVFEWDGAATWEVDLPEGARDVAPRTYLSVRLAQSTRHPNTESLADSLAFGLALVDGAGTEVVLPSAAYGRITRPYERGTLGAGVGWANEFNTVRVRLVDFETLGIDLSDVRTIRLHFGPDHGSPLGRVGLDDIALEDG